MVTLYLLRHGEAESAADLSDIERPLDARGRADADTMGRRLAAADDPPELILCSAAQRARETLSGVIPHLNNDHRIEVEHALYTFEAESVLHRLREAPRSVRSLLVIGHNPGLEVLTGMLAADGTPSAMTQLSTKFPTCALAQIELTTDDWAGLAPKAGRLIRLSIPTAD